MKKLFEKILIKVIAESVEKAFTLENLKIVRTLALERLYNLAETTNTQLDDWAVVLIERLFADDNLEKIYEWVIANVKSVTGLTCMAKPEIIEELTKTLAFDRKGAENVCCSLKDFGIVREILEILLPLLLEWIKRSRESEK